MQASVWARYCGVDLFPGRVWRRIYPEDILSHAGLRGDYRQTNNDLALGLVDPRSEKSSVLRLSISPRGLHARLTNSSRLTTLSTSVNLARKSGWVGGISCSGRTSVLIALRIRSNTFSTMFSSAPHTTGPKKEEEEETAAAAAACIRCPFKYG